MKCLIACVLLLTTLYAVSAAKKSTCYSTPDICVPSVKPTTGIVWKDCSDYCVKCKGREHGKCHKVHTSDCKDGYRCGCLGKHVAKSEILQDAATCRLGL